jgi:hypothetical protein
MRDEAGEIARAIVTPVIVRGVFPNALENRTRACDPPMLVRTSCRSVTSALAAAGSASCAAICSCALAQEPTQCFAAAAAGDAIQADATKAATNENRSILLTRCSPDDDGTGLAE